MIKDDHFGRMELFMSLLEMNGICKSFNGIQVLKEVSLRVEAGEVHALLGENGAGKSTLMNILTGVHDKDAGTVVFDGKEMKNISVKSSENAGIAFVHQELNLFNDLKVYENIFLCREYTNKFGKVDTKRMIKESRELFEELGVEIDPEIEVSGLTTSQKQLLEISKALFFKAKLLILDEPTTALNNSEIEHLFHIIERLKESGTAFIFISHKRPEIFRISDSYTIFRNGEFIDSGKISEADTDTIIQKMVGENYSSGEIYEPRHKGEAVLKLENLSGEGFCDVSFEVKKGEIIGLTGLQGAGSSELLQCMFGATPAYGGNMYVNGNCVPHHSIQAAMKNKVAMLPANRKENSVVPDMSILENMYLAEHVLSKKKPCISKKQEEKKYQNFKDILNIKAADSADFITSLSGGNQQKVFLARWLDTDADILLLDNPTQGIDIGAKAEIYRLILKLASEGKTILLNTLEIPEIKKVADRCIVFYNGKIAGSLAHSQIDETTVMSYATNAVQLEEVL